MSQRIRGQYAQAIFIDDQLPLHDQEVIWFGICTCCGMTHGASAFLLQSLNGRLVCDHLIWPFPPASENGCLGQVAELPDQDVLMAAFKLGGKPAVVDVVHSAKMWHRLEMRASCDPCQEERRKLVLRSFSTYANRSTRR